MDNPHRPAFGGAFPGRYAAMSASRSHTMTESVAPDPTPPATAATTSSRSPISGCADCGWVFGPDLVQTWVLGRLLLVCRNPWSCWERQIELSYREQGILG